MLSLSSSGRDPVLTFSWSLGRRASAQARRAGKELASPRAMEPEPWRLTLMMRSASAPSVPRFCDSKERDARGRKLDISGRDVNPLKGGEFVIGAEPELLSVQN